MYCHIVSDSIKRELVACDSNSLMFKWLKRAILNPIQHRDIGKVLAYITKEYLLI